MNKACIILILSTILVSCMGKHKSDSQQAIIKKPSQSINQDISDTLKVDLSSSLILWKGTKMNGAGKHEGQMQLQDAVFTTSESMLVGGQFTADMNTIEVTDIPEHEPVPRQKFNNHMKSEDFFDTETYPISKFEITSIKQKTMDSLVIAGNLTIKDITKNITFTAGIMQKAFTARFTIDRFQWNIAYEGSWADKSLVALFLSGNAKPTRITSGASISSFIFLKYLIR